jgi:hypothetical protein
VAASSITASIRFFIGLAPWLATPTVAVDQDAPAGRASASATRAITIRALQIKATALGLL